MEQFYIVFLIFTIGWAVVGVVCPFLVPKGENQATIRLMFIETAVFCYLFWLFTYLCQWHPLLGPEMKAHGLHLEHH